MRFVILFGALTFNFSSWSSELCGDSVVGSGFVVGGSAIKRGQWPFIAALFRNDNKKYFCGGTIISTRHVITAGEYI